MKKRKRRKTNNLSIWKITESRKVVVVIAGFVGLKKRGNIIKKRARGGEGENKLKERRRVSDLRMLATKRHDGGGKGKGLCAGFKGKNLR